MNLNLETERLILRPFSEDDASLLFELNNDEDVTRYTGQGAYKNIEEALEFVKGYKQYENYSMGRLNVFIKDTREYIGWSGLQYLKAINEVDIGYRLIKKYWGKGYATEASKACLDYGFNTLKLDKIIRTAMKANIASINVFNKLGLKYSHDDDCGQQPGVVYTITKEEWK